MMQKAAILVSFVALFNFAAASCTNVVQEGNAVACYCEGLRIICKSVNLNSIPTFVADETTYDELDLSGNSLTSIGPNAFQNLKVRKITFGENKIVNNNQLASIDPNAFNGLEAYTREISLVGNNIKDYSQAITAIKKLVNLERITLIDFDQRGIQQSDFGSFIHLEYIKLHSLPLATISSDSFSQNDQLNTLKLIDTNLDQSVINMLKKLPQGVTSLSLEEGKITELTQQFFSGMTNLKELDLSGNQIGIIDDTAFQDIESTITHLNLGGNKLNADQISNIGDLTALLDLKLGTNIIATFPSNNFLKLENLLLTGNQLSSLLIQRDFPNLLTLEVSENHISSTNANSFGHLPKLKSFIMTGQTTTTLVIPSFLGSHSTLEHLELSQFGTAALDETSMWDAIKPLTKLKTLKLQQSKIRTIPDFEFENMQQLETINLSSNEISSITQEMFHGLKDSLKKVDFESNQITSINHCVFQEFNLLDTLGLALNPLHCDCLLTWLVQWHKVHVTDVTSNPWECETPSSLQGDFALLLDIIDDIKTCPVGVTQPTCPNYYTTILTKISTKTDTTVKITWRVNDPTFISTFSIRYNLLPNGLPTTISNISKVEPYEKEVEGLTVNQRYRICAIINLLDTLSSFKPESCVEVITVEIPQVAITVISNDPSNFKIGWTVTDYKYVLGYEISYSEVPDGKEEVLENILETATEKVLTNIKLDTKYEICVVVKLHDTIGAVSPRVCKQVFSSSPMEGTTAKTESGDDSWVVIVGVIGGVIFLIVIVIIIFLLLRKRRAKRMDKEGIPPGVVIQQTFDASAVGGTHGAVGATAADNSHRYRQNEQKGPKTNNNIDVKVVSSGKLGPTRMSAGSYQFLDETSPLGMRPSTSSAYSSNYVNSTGERPLPDQPKDRYKNNSVVSTNTYDEINDKGISNDAFEPTTPTGSPAGSPTRLEAVAPDRKESSQRWSHSGSTAL